MYLYNIFWSSSPSITLSHSSVFLLCPSPLLTFMPCFLFLKTYYLNRVYITWTLMWACLLVHRQQRPRHLRRTTPCVSAAMNWGPRVSHPPLLNCWRHRLMQALCRPVCSVFTRTKAVLHTQNTELCWLLPILQLLHLFSPSSLKFLEPWLGKGLWYTCSVYHELSWAINSHSQHFGQLWVTTNRSSYLWV